jgi:hypothetical protein
VSGPGTAPLPIMVPLMLRIGQMQKLVELYQRLPR